jgi:hypothetical protein
MNMRKLILLAIVLGQCASAHASTYANRTFLMPRAPLHDLVLENSTWHRQHQEANKKKGHGASIQVTATYQHSSNSSATGKYFGYYAPTKGEFRNYINVVDPNTFPEVTDDATWAEYIVHNTANNAMNFSGKIAFRPMQELFMTGFNLYEDCSCHINGLFFSFSLPIVNVKNSLRLTDAGNATPIEILGHQSLGKGLFDYFKGNVQEFRFDNSADNKWPLPMQKWKTIKAELALPILKQNLVLL